MKKKKSKKNTPKIPDLLLAIRKGNREAEREILGDGFHAKTRIQKSKKLYTRKTKHPKQEE